ncbi:branched-chain amino acid ABC transporter permease [Pusillimonas caeni]|uniref:branched-chain amino acid ABC transporter permease n=1 Tax=Pusillimonas caeni TaxID=1348472 RepID=UPI0010754030|nr:branched-chain amino acid ABC transporter permease [Pusillimonas caeni]TFL10209.1 branched-chain amino acid ABC transporter permease [Pusillimonas caeni]
MSELTTTGRSSVFEGKKGLGPRGMLLGAGVAAAVLPAFANEYWQFVANMALVYCLVTLGFNIVLGYLGQLAFANVAFFGVGAYATAIAMNAGFPLLLALPAGAAVTGLVGFLFGLPALRIKGYQLAIVTLAAGELFRWLYIHGGDITKGSSGLGIPMPSVFGIPLDSEIAKYWTFLVITVLCFWLTRNLLRSSIGRAIVAVRNNELAGIGLGMHAAGFKVLAFTWSALLVGMAGGMYACLLGRVTPESFGLTQLLVQFAMVMVGGLGSFVGSAFGALLLTAVPEVLRNFPGLEEIFFSVLLMIVLRFAPQGIGGVISARVPALRDTFVGGKS